MHSISEYQDGFIDYLESQKIVGEPKSLYEPIQYILSLGGKRIRPVLTLMVAEVFDLEYKKALPAAFAVEVFHNFSLVHDDIIDDAPLRRGKETVHEKWNINTGILSGDAMLILAYQYFEQYEPVIFQALAKIFSKTALEVCEGQQWDVDFENRDDVTIPEYLKMIEYKTAVLVGAAMKMGAIIAETSIENCEAIYNFGLNLGIAFQLQDDYLDAFGDPETFGKQVGGDIIENKKTILFHHAMSNGSINEKKELLKWYDKRTVNEIGNKKIDVVKSIFDKTNAREACMKLIKDYTIKAFNKLSHLGISQEAKTLFKNFGNNLMKREF